MEQNRTCILCNERLVGRSDKRFCNDYCRNTYNNRKLPSGVRMISRTILHNRAILEAVTGALDTRVVSQDQLLQLGFSFSYFTHICEAPDGKKWRVCFTIGYRILNNQKVVLQRINTGFRIHFNMAE